MTTRIKATSGLAVGRSRENTHAAATHSTACGIAYTVRFPMQAPSDQPPGSTEQQLPNRPLQLAMEKISQRHKIMGDADGQHSREYLREAREGGMYGTDAED